MNIRYISRWLSLLTLTAGLIGCGFHLRGYGYGRIPITQIHIVSPKIYGQFEQRLRIAFERSHIDVIENPSAPATLVIHATDISHHTPSIGTSAQARVYTFRYAVFFELLINNQPALMNQHIQVTQQITVPAGQLLSTNNQLDLIKRHLQHDAITQIFHRLHNPTVQKRLVSLQPPSAKAPSPTSTSH